MESDKLEQSQEGQANDLSTNTPAETEATEPVKMLGLCANCFPGQDYHCCG